MNPGLSGIISISVCIIFIAVIIIIAFSRDVSEFSEINAVKPINITEYLTYAAKEDPYVIPFIIENVLTRIQCNKFITYAINKIDNGLIDGRYVQNKYSKQTWILKNDPIVSHIIDNIAKLLYTSSDYAENVQIVRYLPYQTYAEKYDSCCDNNVRCKDFIKRGGQRRLAIIIYLNQDFDGGETYFRNLNLKFKPNEGSGIVIYPLAENSHKCHPDSIHSSLPINKSDKWVMNIWFRENKVK